MEKTVMAFGTFDLLHPGHLDFLRQAKRLGDRLTVLVARDHNVKRIKGKAPRHSERERRAAVRLTGLADQVIPGHANDFNVPVRRIRPDVIAMGYDQRVDTVALKRDFPHIKLVRLLAHHPERYKSSLMKSM